MNWAVSSGGSWGSALEIENRKKFAQRKEATDVYKKTIESLQTKSPRLKELEALLLGEDVDLNQMSEASIEPDKDLPQRTFQFESDVSSKDWQLKLATKDEVVPEYTVEQQMEQKRQRWFDFATNVYNIHMQMPKNGYIEVQPLFFQYA